MKIEINTENFTYFDLWLLGKITKAMEEHAGVKTDGDAPQYPEPEVVEEAPAEDAPRKRGRKKADHLKVVETVEQPAPIEEEKTATDTVEEVATKLTLDDVRACLQSFSRKNGVPASVELLKKFGASRISDLDVKHYEAFRVECGA